MAVLLLGSAAAGGTPAPEPGTTERVSLSPTGDQLARESRLAETRSVSARGEQVVFQTYQALVPEDVNDRPDVYLRDRAGGTTTLVSRDEQGAAAGGGGASLSGDGATVVFATQTALLPRDTDSDYDLYARDLADDSLTLVSASRRGLSGRGEATDAVISGDGSAVAFLTPQRLLRRDRDPQGPESWRRFDVYVRDLADGGLRLVSVDRRGRSFEGLVGLGGISRDGQRIGFHTTGDTVPAGHWVRDLDRRGARLVWAEDLSTSRFALTGTPALSGNGRFAAVLSARRDVDDEGEYRLVDLVRIDLRTGRLRVVCCREGTRYEDGYGPRTPVLSGAGDRIAFTLEYGVAPGDDDDWDDVYLADLAGGPRLRLLSRGLVGSGNGASGTAGLSISADGRQVAFSSWADDLIDDDTNNTLDVFLWSDAS